jgi:phosphohistidine phosphatase SixA
LEDSLTNEGIEKLQSEEFITNVLRLELDKIYASHATRTMQTAKAIQDIYKTHLNIDLDIIEDKRLRDYKNIDIKETYQDILNKTSKLNKSENILIVSHDVVFTELWKQLF